MVLAVLELIGSATSNLTTLGCDRPTGWCKALYAFLLIVNTGCLVCIFVELCTNNPRLYAPYYVYTVSLLPSFHSPVGLLRVSRRLSAHPRRARLRPLRHRSRLDREPIAGAHLQRLFVLLLQVNLPLSRPPFPLSVLFLHA